MKLDIKQRAFKADEITYMDRKAITLDRTMLKLFEMLRFDGRPPVRRVRKAVEVENLVKAMAEEPERFPGFINHPEAAGAWLANDLLEIMNRGKPGREAVVGPRPFHLNAYKLTNPKAAQDYGSAEQVWAMIYHADPELLAHLRDFFGRGLDRHSDRYDRTTPLDLETLAILNLADQVTVSYKSTPVVPPRRPLCAMQGRVLCDDLRRLLAYESVVPRHVLANYIRTVIGLHLALFMLRLFRLVPARVGAALRGEVDPQCPIESASGCTLAKCAWTEEIVVSLAPNANSGSARLAMDSAAGHLDGLTAYVRAVVLINRVKDYAGTRSSSFEDLLAIVREPTPDMDGFFQARINDAIALQNSDDEEDPVVTQILQLPHISKMEKYVELICLERLKHERSQLTHLIDALAQKNRPEGFLRQSAGARSARWFSLEPNLLETLVQIAVLERDAGAPDGFASRNILIDEFITWLHERYGFVIYAPSHRVVPPEEHEAWRQNERELRERLRQIGFFTDLSDAYNSQTLRPRYKIQASGTPQVVERSGE